MLGPFIRGIRGGGREGGISGRERKEREGGGKGGIGKRMAREGSRKRKGEEREGEGEGGGKARVGYGKNFISKNERGCVKKIKPNDLFKMHLM